jgi:hypothetical protein
MDDFDGYSGKYWQVLDALEDRFRVRWKHVWSDALWSELKRFKHEGNEAAGLKLLPNSAKSIRLVSYNVFNPMLVLSEEDEETGIYKTRPQLDKKAICLRYLFDADGVKFVFYVFTENDAVQTVLVDESERLDTLAQYEGTLATAVEENARQLFG